MRPDKDASSILSSVRVLLSAACFGAGLTLAFYLWTSASDDTGIPLAPALLESKGWHLSLVAGRLIVLNRTVSDTAPNSNDGSRVGGGLAEIAYNDYAKMVRVGSVRVDGNSATWFLAAPLWPAIALISVALAFWAARQFRLSQASPGLCPNCGYDLRASKDRCPECGTPIRTPPPKQSNAETPQKNLPKSPEFP